MKLKAPPINLKTENILSQISFTSHLHPSTLPKPITTPSLYTARACRHFIAAAGDMGWGMQTMYFGGLWWQEK